MCINKQGNRMHASSIRYNTCEGIIATFLATIGVEASLTRSTLYGAGEGHWAIAREAASAVTPLAIAAICHSSE